MDRSAVAHLLLCGMQFEYGGSSEADGCTDGSTYGGFGRGNAGTAAVADGSRGNAHRRTDERAHCDADTDAGV